MGRKRTAKVPDTTGAPATAAPAFHPPINPVHGQKIDKLLALRKTPAADKPRVQAAVGDILQSRKTLREGNWQSVGRLPARRNG